MLISIIMPIYNGEKHLSTAIESVLAQTYKNFELILIDDMSIDSSSIIAKKYSERDERVKFYQNTTNLGICRTRNKGLDCAVGEFVGFIDNDDEIKPDFLEGNLKYISRKNVDGVKFGRFLIDVNDQNILLRESETTFYKKESFEYTKEEKYKNYHHFKNSNLLMNVWNGLYRREVIIKNNLFFDPTMKFGSEDAKFSYEFFMSSNSLVINPKSYYVHYRRNISSTSRKFSLNKIDSLLKTAETESKIWNGLYDKKEKSMIDMYKLNYIKIIISNQILHTGSNLKFREQKKLIDKIISNDLFQFGYFRKRNVSTLDNILFYLIYKKNSYFILILYKIYKLRRGEKW